MQRVWNFLLISAYLAATFAFIYLGQKLPADNELIGLIGLLFLGALALGSGIALRAIAFKR